VVSLLSPPPFIDADFGHKVRFDRDEMLVIYSQPGHHWTASCQGLVIYFETG